MRRLLIASAVLTLLGAISVALAPAISAGDTTVNVEVTGGALSISSQPASATLTGAQYSATAPSTASGAFGMIEVTDGRGLTTPWTVSASSTDFVGLANPAQSIALGASSPLTFEPATVTVGPAGSDGAGTALGGALTAASTPQAIATGTNAALAAGNVTYQWNPQLTLVVPAGTAPQTYRGTVTLTVA